MFIITLFFSLNAFTDDKGCFSFECFEDRIINVIIIKDSKYYSDIFIKKSLDAAFEKVNTFYYDNFKIKWKVVNITNFSQNTNALNISELYSFHKQELGNLVFKSGAEVGLVVVGNNIKGLGIAGTFSNIAMISNIETLELQIRGVIIAHEFAHLFGAWHTQKKHDFMLFRGANTFDVSRESKAILKLMRNYNFKPDSIIKKDKLLKRISRIYLRHHARNEIDPVARLLTDKGSEHFKNNNYVEASEILQKSLKYYGKWGKTRMILSKTFYELDQYNKSFTELTRAIFFGEKPDLHFEKKLRDKFIELEKKDPNIINPFVN